MIVLSLSSLPSTQVTVTAPDRARAATVAHADVREHSFIRVPEQTPEATALAAELASVKGKHKATVLAGVARGTSTGACAAELGIALAGMGFGRVLVIEADPAQRASERLLHIRQGAGLLEVLNGTTTLQSATQAAAKSVDVLRYAAEDRPAEDGGRALAGSAVTRLITEACEMYDHILVAAPPIEEGVDARLLAAQCGSIVLAVRSGQETVTALAAAHASFEKTAVQPLGVVLL